MDMDNILGPLLAFLVIALPLWLAYALLKLDARLDGWFHWKQSQAARSHPPRDKEEADDA